MNIEIPNLLSPGQKLEIFKDLEAGAMIWDEGFSEEIRAFTDRSLAQAKQPEPIWTMWEGYWKETGSNQTLICLGILYRRPRFYPRALRVQQVAPLLVSQTRDALVIMLNTYLDSMLPQLPGYFGTGKSYGHWLS